MVEFQFKIEYWTFIKEFCVWRIFQDDITNKVIFRDEMGYCYKTNPKIRMRFLVSCSLIVEQLTEEIGRIRDAWNNEFLMLSSIEINKLAYKRISMIFYPFSTIVATNQVPMSKRQ